MIYGMFLKGQFIIGLTLTITGSLSITKTVYAADLSACIIPAASFHYVNPLILRSILNIESGHNPSLISKNSDGSMDIGAAGINSINFPELAKWGITPNHLLDPCVSTYVAAWILSKKIKKYGNTWQGIASYHSTTPYYNIRYQILLHNDLVRNGVIAGSVLPVPPLRNPSEKSLQMRY